MILLQVREVLWENVASKLLSQKFWVKTNSLHSLHTLVQSLFSLILSTKSASLWDPQLGVSRMVPFKLNVSVECSSNWAKRGTKVWFQRLESKQLFEQFEQLFGKILPAITVSNIERLLLTGARNFCGYPEGNGLTIRLLIIAYYSCRPQPAPKQPKLIYQPSFKVMIWWAVWRVIRHK